MKKLTVLGIIGGAALLAAVPFSIQWSQTNGGSAGPTMLLTLSQAEAAIRDGAASSAAHGSPGAAKGIVRVGPAIP
jgi:hypothetical protein